MRRWRIIRPLGRRWVIALAVAVLLLLGYLWAGYVLAPRLIRSEAMRWAQARPGVALALGPIKVDPLHITVSVRDIRLSEHGRPLASLQRLFVGFAPLGLLEGTYHVTQLDLDAPQLNVVIGAHGKLNLAALSAPAGHQASGPLPHIRIDALRIEQGRLSVTDHGRSPAARETLAPITLSLVHFRSWRPSGGRFAFQAASGDGAHIVWWGQVSMTPFASSGTLSLTGARLTALARFLPAQLPVPRAGHISVSAEYTAQEGAHGFGLRVTDLGASASALALEGGPHLHGIIRIAEIRAAGGTLRLAAGGAADAALARLTVRHVLLSGTGAARGQTVSLGTLSLTGTRLDTAPQRIAVGTLELAGLHLPVRRGRGGRLALLRFLPLAKRPQARPARAPAASTWSMRLGELEVRDATVPVMDLTVAPAAHFEIRLYSLTARALSSNLERPVPFTLRAGIAPRGYLSLSGRVTPGRDSAAVWLSVAHLPLRPFVPYLPLARTAEVHSGTLGARVFADIVAARLLRVSGRTDVRDLQLLDRATGTGLFGWQALSVSGISYQPKRLVIGRARLTAPSGMIVILPNRTLNLAALLPPHPQAGAAKKTAVPAGTPAKSQVPALSAVLKRLDIVNGSITFADESIEPHFHAPVDALHGTILNVSTSKSSIAHIALAGQVINPYSPVAVSGSFNPYGLGSDTDIRASFDNIQLPIFDPYSNRYAGYAIAKGILSAHFRYRINDRQLNADHHIVVEQLQWGGPSQSKQTVGWPIRLATALLKDRNGVIRINLPVTGSLSDPNFHIASIVWMMLVHLLEKAALAPFDLIGRLFAGAAQAQYISFRPGSAALPNGAAASLTALAHALAKRPALEVDIPAGPAGPEDAVALENDRIDALALVRIHAAPPGGFAALSLPEQLRALTSLYRARLGKRPVFPPHLPSPPAPPATPAPPAAPRPPKSAVPAAPPSKRIERERGEIQWLREQLRPTARPGPGALAALGLARAQNVQNALLAHGALGPKRLFITTQEAGEPWHGRIRLKLRLK